MYAEQAQPFQNTRSRDLVSQIIQEWLCICVVVNEVFVYLGFREYWRKILY